MTLPADPDAYPVRYRIKPSKPGAHLFSVDVQVVEPDRNAQLLRLPAWIPGSYMVRDYARHVVSVSASNTDGSLAIDKPDKSTWRVENCSTPLTVRFEIYAWDLSVRGAHLDTTHAYFNAACVFPAVLGQEHRKCSVEIVAADDKMANLTVATAMRRIGAPAYGYGLYATENYDELLDHPVEIAEQQIIEFQAAGVPHAIAIRGADDFDDTRLAKDLSTLCTAHHDLLGTPTDLDRYVFLTMALGKGYGGLEHRWSSSLMCRRDELPVPGVSKVTRAYRHFLGLASHEYFHLWNVKRMKPQRFTPYDLRGESHTGLLWVFEGITSYYDDLVLCRSGLIDTDAYLDLLAQTITRVLRTPGRFRQTLEESSFDAWTKLYKADSNSPNSLISYYTKGALVALALDLKLRTQTTSCTLDTVMRECWRRYGETGDGMPERGLEAIAAEVSELPLGEFFDRYVRGTEDPPLEELFARVGIDMQLRVAKGVTDAGGSSAKGESPKSWFGAQLAVESASVTVRTVFADGPFQHAGVSAGDELLAINGTKASADMLKVLTSTRSPGDTLTVTVFRRDKLMQFDVVLSAPPNDTCTLNCAVDAEDSVLAQRISWLKG